MKSSATSCQATWSISLFVLMMGCASKGPKLEAGPYLQSATPHDIWILWETSSGNQSQVMWGTEPDVLDFETKGQSERGFGKSRVHSVQLTELSPDTQYFYQVQTGQTQSDVYDFVTPPAPEAEQSFRLLAMSDMQRDSEYPRKFEAMVTKGIIPYVTESDEYELSDSIGLTVIPGDLVMNGNDYDQWKDDFFEPSSDLFAHVPLYPVMGNHEYDSPYYKLYFQLPENGTEGFEEHWYTVDYSNLRVIGLDSNEDYRIQEQLDWLDQVLADTCQDDSIDFVFAQLHHPHESELWVPGEVDYVGDVIVRLEDFTTECEKPSLHFFGHTHGYSRGQSQEHEHLWVNVATAGGSVDEWGEYPQADYEQYSVTQAEYGFVIVDVEAGDSPQFELRRISRGSPDEPLDNVERDHIVVRRYNEGPQTPEAIAPLDEVVSADCLYLDASPYSDPEGDHHGASHWQVSLSCEDFSNPVIDRWRQHENWFFGVDTQAGDVLEDALLSFLQPEEAYCWRVRYRDQSLAWSEWSSPAAFETQPSTFSNELLSNGGAEQESTDWYVHEGVFESLSRGQCNGRPPKTGERYFSVGGICESSEVAEVSQDIDLREFTEWIETGEAGLRFEASMATWAKHDVPEAWVEIRDEHDQILYTSHRLSSRAATWTQQEVAVPIPPRAQTARVILRGTRTHGDDNDSYFDDLSVRFSTSFSAIQDCSH